ncbi:DUF397 domain-containing protein [Nonomuraea sp. NPDC050790]|uniref:DUF397 domain-containing protein n=1 Tax=Nonomuraea sp. NPDC050790 TaxID=3364371 RepID=UPI0037A25D8D
MDSPVPHWFKSSYSATNGACVEVAGLPGGRVGVRDTKNRSGGTLAVSLDAWRDFVEAVKSGDLPRE